MILVIFLFIVLWGLFLIGKFRSKEKSLYAPIGYFPIGKVHLFDHSLGSTSNDEHDGYIIKGDNIIYFTGAVVFEGPPSQEYFHSLSPNLYLRNPNNLVFEGGVFLSQGYSIANPYWKKGRYISFNKKEKISHIPSTIINPQQARGTWTIDDYSITGSDEEILQILQNLPSSQFIITVFYELEV